MEQRSKTYGDPKNESAIQFLNEMELAQLESADANPFVKISIPDKSIPFIVTTDGGVVADITANTIKNIIKNLESLIPADKLYGGAGFIDVFYGNQLLVFRRIESSIFKKNWHVDDIASALQSELNLYYPGYRIRSR